MKSNLEDGFNLGGKSVTMQTAGLLALMVQCGMPVPADVEMDEHLFSGYENLFVDTQGAYAADSYLPAYVRRYPFVLANDAQALGMEVVGYDKYLTLSSAWGLSRAVARAASPSSLVG